MGCHGRDTDILSLLQRLVFHHYFRTVCGEFYLKLFGCVLISTMAKSARFIKCSFSPNDNRCGRCGPHQWSSHDHLADDDSVDATTMKTKKWPMENAQQDDDIDSGSASTMQQEMTSSCVLEADMRLEAGRFQGNPNLPHTTILSTPIVLSFTLFSS